MTEFGDGSVKRRVLVVDRHAPQTGRIVGEVYRAAGEAREGVRIYTADTVKEAERVAGRQDIDLLVLDNGYKEMSKEEGTGLGWVEKLRATEKYVALPVICIASCEEEAQYACETLNCLGYFPGGFESENLQKVLKRALHYETVADEERFLWLRQKTMLYPVRIKDVVYAECSRQGVYVYLNDGIRLETRKSSVKEILDMAKCRSMVQCQKGTIVNTSYIEKTEHAGSIIVLYSGRGVLPVGRSYREALKEAMKYER